MNEKTKLGFFKFISNQKIRLQIIETALIQNDMIDSVIYTDEFGFLAKKNPNSVTVFQYLSRLLEENSIKSRLLKLHNSKVCYFYKKNKKKLYSETRIKELLKEKKFNKSVEIIQKFSANLFKSEKIAKAKLVYAKKNYQSSCFLGNDPVTDQLLLSKILDLVTLITSALEKSELKRVVILKLEFLIDNDGCLWLLNCEKCMMVEAQLTICNSINGEGDIIKLAKTLTKNSLRPDQILKQKRGNKYYQLTPKTLDSNTEKYTFKRGQLRNTSSNLNSPIRILSPYILEYNELKNQKKLSPTPKLEKTSSVPNVYIGNDYKQLLSPDRPFSKFEFPISKETDESSISLIDNEDIMIPKRKSGPKQLTEVIVKSSTLEKPEKHRKKTFSLQKLVPITPKTQRPVYGNNFMECILKTYCKEQELEPILFQQEFGIGPRVTYEEFSNIINRCDKSKSINEISGKNNRLSVKPVLEEASISRMSTPAMKNRPQVKQKKNLVKDKSSRKISTIIQDIKRKSSERISIIITTPRTSSAFAVKSEKKLKY